MRITSLRLVNFTPIYYSLDLTEVSLEYNTSKTIYIFIGKMGSCKTFLLGHHQPFATLGTLDARNADDLILPGKRGVKEITYQVGPDTYEILHLFIPTGEHHTLKSYIKKNGQELNENGNSNSFKAIVLSEFGLDQNFLKLFRIGSNVTNLPDMTSSERKSFIGSMLTETDVCAFLYRRLSERARSINAQMTLLTNRIQSISSRSDEELERDCLSYETKMQETNERYQKTLEDKYRIEAELGTILGDRSEGAYIDRAHTMKSELKYATKKRDEISAQLKDIEQVPETIGEDIAKTEARIEMRRRTILDISASLDDTQAKKRKLSETLAIMASSEQMEALKESYQAMLNQAAEFEKQLKFFSYEGTMASIDNIINECHIVNGLIVAVCQYSTEAIRELFDNPHKAKYVMERELGKLHRERQRVNQELANLKYIGTYVPNHVMLRPYNCPTKECPFYQYHPIIEQRKRGGAEVDSRWAQLHAKLGSIDGKINYYDGFPELASRIEHLCKTWERVFKMVSPLGVVQEDNLRDIVLNPTKREWFNEVKLNRIRELCSIREQYYELMQAIKSTRNELTAYEMSDRESLERELSILSDIIVKDTVRLSTMEKENDTDAKSLSHMTYLQGIMLQAMSLEAELKQTEDDIERLTAEIETTDQILQAANRYKSQLAKIQTALDVQREEFKAAEAEYNNLNRKLNDIAYTRTQYDQVKSQQEIMRDCVESISSKNGIPLAYIKLFLADCKSDINDLISDVFADHIEVQEFFIPEDGSAFFIPYIKNGKIINDVVKASQGERAIISLALAFALIRQNSFLYNIMLIDEMDGPLYKEDRNKFILLLMKQIQAINAEQVFLVSHNNTFDGFNVGIIMTTEEDVEENALTSVIRVGKR